MSHIRTQKSKIPVTQLDALKKACSNLGCELVMESKFNWWSGQSNCDALIRPSDHKDMAKSLGSYRSAIFDVGLKLDGENVEFMFDNFGGSGQWIKDKLCRDTARGVTLDKLQEHFQAEVFSEMHRQSGCIVEEPEYQNGELVVEAYMP